MVEDRDWRVLIVDDEVSMRQALSILGEKVGWQTELAATAEEAIEVLERTDIDAILTDKNLPGMSGIDLLRWVREYQLDPVLVMLTAHPSGESALETLRLNIDGFIPKPIPNLAAFAERIGSLLRARDRRRQQGQPRSVAPRDRSLMILSADEGLRRAAVSELTNLVPNPLVHNSVADAMRTLEEDPPTVALVDTSFADDEILRMIQAAQGWAAGTRFILLGDAAPSLGLVSELIAMGVSDYIKRPWESGMLEREVETALGRPVSYVADQTNPGFKLERDTD